jgi:hypothetical protein
MQSLNYRNLYSFKKNAHLVVVKSNSSRIVVTRRILASSFFGHKIGY